MVRQRKDGHVLARDDDDEPLLLDLKPPRHTQSQFQLYQSTSEATLVNKPAAGGSDTEDDESDSAQSPPKKHKNNLPTPARSLSPEIVVDPGRAPGRIIGTTYPLKDFQKNISQGDVVSKAVEDLGHVIKEIVLKPFTSRRNVELLECMRTLRDTALKVGLLAIVYLIRC